MCPNFPTVLDSSPRPARSIRSNMPFAMNNVTIMAPFNNVSDVINSYNNNSYKDSCKISGSYNNSTRTTTHSCNNTTSVMRNSSIKTVGDIGGTIVIILSLEALIYVPLQFQRVREVQCIGEAVEEKGGQ